MIFRVPQAQLIFCPKHVSIHPTVLDIGYAHCTTGQSEIEYLSIVRPSETKSVSSVLEIFETVRKRNNFVIFDPANFSTIQRPKGSRQEHWLKWVVAEVKAQNCLFIYKNGLLCCLDFYAAPVDVKPLLCYGLFETGFSVHTEPVTASVFNIFNGEIVVGFEPVATVTKQYQIFRVMLFCFSKRHPKMVIVVWYRAAQNAPIPTAFANQSFGLSINIASEAMFVFSAITSPLWFILKRRSALEIRKSGN